MLDNLINERQFNDNNEMRELRIINIATRLSFHHHKKSECCNLILDKRGLELQDAQNAHYQSIRELNIEVLQLEKKVLTKAATCKEITVLMLLVQVTRKRVIICMIILETTKAFLT